MDTDSNNSNHNLVLTATSSSGSGSRSDLTARCASSEGRLEDVTLNSIQARAEPILMSELGLRDTVCELQGQYRAWLLGHACPC